MNVWLAPIAGLFVAGAIAAAPATATAGPLKLADPAAKVERSVTADLVHKRKRYRNYGYYPRRGYRSGYGYRPYYRPYYYGYPYGYSRRYYGYPRHHRRQFYGHFGGHGFGFGFQSYR